MCPALTLWASIETTLASPYPTVLCTINWGLQTVKMPNLWKTCTVPVPKVDRQWVKEYRQVAQTFALLRPSKPPLWAAIAVYLQWGFGYSIFTCIIRSYFGVPDVRVLCFDLAIGKLENLCMKSLSFTNWIMDNLGDHMETMRSSVLLATYNMAFSTVHNVTNVNAHWWHCCDMGEDGIQGEGQSSVPLRSGSIAMDYTSDSRLTRGLTLYCNSQGSQ